MDLGQIVLQRLDEGRQSTLLVCEDLGRGTLPGLVQDPGRHRENPVTSPTRVRSIPERRCRVRQRIRFLPALLDPLPDLILGRPWVFAIVHCPRDAIDELVGVDRGCHVGSSGNPIEHAMSTRRLKDTLAPQIGFHSARHHHFDQFSMEKQLVTGLVPIRWSPIAQRQTGLPQTFSSVRTLRSLSVMTLRTALSLLTTVRASDRSPGVIC